MHNTRRQVLLTGAAGVIGRALVDELARDTTLLCVRRRRTIGDDRVHELTGDVTLPGLGLDASQRRLLSNVDSVVHCAAVTSFKADAKRTYGANLDGTRHVAELAAGLGARLYHVSTAFVTRAADWHVEGASGSPAAARAAPAGGRPAGEVVASPATYLASKVEAERWVRDRMPEAVLIRPALVAGDSVTGHIGQFQGLYQLFGGIASNAVPLLPVPATSLVDFLPLDVVAQGIAALVRGGVVGGGYWLTAGERALDAGRLVPLTHEVARSFGRTVHRPRFVADGSVVDRLLMPLLDDVIPPALRRQFVELLELAPLFRTDVPFPSSLDELGLAGRVTEESQSEAFVRSLRYWAVAQGLTNRPEQPRPGDGDARPAVRVAARTRRPRSEHP
jgi:nucleoside-diphosphate-sugar epimerase